MVGKNMFFQWATRCAVLLGVSLAFALVYAGVKPMPPGAFASYGATPAAAPSGPVADGGEAGDGTAVVAGPDAKGDVHDLEWFRAAAEDGTHWVLDARSTREYLAGHVPGSIHLEFGMFTRGAPEKVELLRGMPMVIYCGGGDCDASHKVKTMLEAYGLDQIYVFVPGFPVWEQAGYPVEQGESPF